MGSPAESVTEPVGLAHPRAVPVRILSTAGGLRAELLAAGAVRLSPAPGRGACGGALNVDGQLVSFAAPGGNARRLEQALREALPVEYELRTWFDRGRVVAAFLRLAEAEGVMVDARCSRGGHAVYPERTNRFLLSGRVFKAARLRLTLNTQVYELALKWGDTPRTTAARLQRLLGPGFAVAVAPTAGLGDEDDVRVTVTPCAPH